MTFRSTTRLLGLVPCALILIFLSASSVIANCAGQTEPPANDPLHMLVLGDSITWGQGLKTEQKFWWRVKCWLQAKTNRQVLETVEAHSGAVIGTPSASPATFNPRDGEVNTPFPSIHQQVDHALAAYGENRTKVNLILLDGCINDVGTTNLLNAAGSLERLRPRIEASCGASMLDLLRRVTQNFPNAYVLVTGYYPIISSKTDDSAFLRMLVKKVARSEEESEARGRVLRMTDKEMRQRLIAISQEWYERSTVSLAAAVNSANQELNGGLQPRVMFVEIDFSSEHAFAAPDTLLWNFVFGSTNLSGFRHFIVALSFGSDAYKPNDQTRASRTERCKETFKKPKGIKESKTEKQNREDGYLICRYASLGHPNQMGALLYAEAIKGRLQWILDKAGWPRSAPAPVPATP